MNVSIMNQVNISYYMRKKVSALFRTYVFAAFVPALALSLVACEPEDNEPDTEVVETEG